MLLQACAKFRFLRSDQLIALAGGSEQNLKRRLQKLFHAGYLDRILDPVEARRYHLEKLGSPKTIYAIGNRGVKHLETELDYPPSKTRCPLCQ